jgi:transcriptional regulator with XRE-family HTH domain
MALKSRKRFGDFIRYSRRNSSNYVSLSDMADLLGISVSLLSDIESGRRKPFDTQRIELFAKTVALTAEEKAVMYDLAAKERNAVPADIESVMMDGDIGDMARLALRETNAGNATEEDWKQLIRAIEQRKRGQAK